MNAAVQGYSLVSIIALIRKEIERAKTEGPQGKEGKAGAAGERGAKGDTGPAGKQGPKGGNGKQGKAGKDGKDGQDGTDGVGIANIEQDVDDAIVVTMTDGETYTIEMPLNERREVHYKVGGGGSSSGSEGTVDLSNYVQKPTTDTAWMVYKKGTGWAPVTTDLVATNPDVIFRDTKGRFKSTKELEGLTNQLEVNRYFADQFEAIGDASQLLTDAPADGKYYGRQDNKWSYISFDTKNGNRRMNLLMTARLATNQVLPEFSGESTFALSEPVEGFVAPEEPETGEMANYVYLTQYRRISFNNLDSTMNQLQIGDFIEFSNYGAAQHCLIMRIVGGGVTQVDDRYEGVFDFEIDGYDWGDLVRIKEGLQFTFHATKSGGGGIEEAPSDNAWYGRKNGEWFKSPAYAKEQTQRLTNHSKLTFRQPASPDSTTHDFELSVGPLTRAAYVEDETEGAAVVLANWADYDTITFSELDYSMRHTDVGDIVEVGEAGNSQRTGTLLKVTSVSVEQAGEKFSGSFGYELVGRRHEHEQVQKNAQYYFHLLKQTSSGGSESGDLPPIDVNPTPDTLVKRTSAGNAQVKTLVAEAGSFGGPQVLRSFNVYGEGDEGRLSLQSNEEGGPGLEMTLDGNATRCLLKTVRKGESGMELQTWTTQVDGVIHQPFVFGADGAFFFRQVGSTTPTNYNTEAGIKNDAGKLHFKHDDGDWSRLYSADYEFTPNTLVLRDGNANIKGRKVIGQTFQMTAGGIEDIAPRPDDTIFYSSINNQLFKNSREGMRAALGITDVPDGVNMGEAYRYELKSITPNLASRPGEMTVDSWNSDYVTMISLYVTDADSKPSPSAHSGYYVHIEFDGQYSLYRVYGANDSQYMQVNWVDGDLVTMEEGRTYTVHIFQLVENLWDGENIDLGHGNVKANKFIGDGSELTNVATRSELAQSFTEIQHAIANEDTVDGLKKALRNALGGLIEKFEGNEAGQ